jgi:hypothetical protein
VWRFLRAIGRRLVEIVPGVVVAVALIRLAPPASAAEAVAQVSLGVVVGLLGVVLIDGAVVETEVKAYREDVRGYREDVNHLHSLLSGQLAWSALSRTMLELGSMEVPGNEFYRFYLNVLWSIERSYVTTFLATETSATESHNRLALEIQRTKARVTRATIRRLFIFMRDEQRDAHQEMMKAQKDAGIEVRYIFDRALTSERDLLDWSKRVGSVDFSIIDGRIVLETFVQTSRGRRVAIERSTVSTDLGRVADYEFFFSLLWERGVEPPE